LNNGSQPYFGYFLQKSGQNEIARAKISKSIQAADF